MMLNRQIKQFYINKENSDHSITDRLMNGGYVQPSGGYITTAKRAGIKEPIPQYWHLINSWCAQSEDDAPFTRSIQCGELIFYMAESSHAIDKDILNKLCDRILSDDVTNRRYWNREIQNICFDSIVDTITKAVQ